MNEAPADQRAVLPLGIAALGVVFGDIGTSPLYAMRQCFTGVNSVSATSGNIMGVLSLVFWALIIIISLKYLLFVMRRDNHGEGGIIALVALLGPVSKRHAGVRLWLIPLGLFGAALLYGDGTITPAISVLSAMEGLSADNPAWRPWTIPLTVAILGTNQRAARLAIGLVVCLWIVDWAFLSANLFKFLDGGWYPLIVGIVVFTIMSTWRRGRQLLTQRMATGRESLQDFRASQAKQYASRIPGTAVFLTAQSEEPPPILLHHLSHHHLLHERIILLTVRTRDIPRVPAAERIQLEELSKDCFRLELCYGYFQSPNVPIALRLCEHLGLSIDPDNVTYYLGRETLIPTDDDIGISLWRERLFAFLASNAQRAPVFYSMPTERVVELGIQIEL